MTRTLTATLTGLVLLMGCASDPPPRTFEDDYQMTTMYLTEIISDKKLTSICYDYSVIGSDGATLAASNAGAEFPEAVAAAYATVCGEVN